MVIKNKQTKKEYPCSKSTWEAYPQRIKDLFLVVDDSELKNPETQPIQNTLEKKLTKKAVKAPHSGNKVDGNSKHKKA